MTMPILRLGLIAGAIAFLYVSWASYGAGFPTEVAIVRGMLAFMALSFVAYLGELVVATAPPATSARDDDAERTSDEGTDDDEDTEPEGGGDERAEDVTDITRIGALAGLPSRFDNDEQAA